MSQRAPQGTRMVQSLCDVLDTMQNDTELETVLTLVKRTMHNKNYGFAQTPEVKMFPHKAFSVAKYNKNI